MKIENFYSLLSGNPVNAANPDSENVEGKAERTNLNSQLPTTSSTQLDAEKLKLIDDFSRLILELKRQFPELAQNLEKARDNISARQESIPIKNFMNLLSAIQQNLNTQKPELAETIKNLVNEIVKILRPSTEAPPENKLILALSKNDFASADIAIKNIIEQATKTPLTQLKSSPQQTFQVILNALQELKELGIPKELQKAPLKELEAIVLQKTGIEIPKDLAKNLSAIFSEKPVFAEIRPSPAPASFILQELPAPQQKELPVPHQRELPNQQQKELPVLPQTKELPLPQQKEMPLLKFDIPLPKNFPELPQLSAPAPVSAPVSASPKNEMAFSLYKITAPQIEAKSILQPWVASSQIPKEERNLWLKADLPLTPQTLNIRDAILSLGNLPEKPELLRLFVSTMHELSLQTEHGKSISKEQTNLLWRVINHLANSPPAQTAPPAQTTQQQPPTPLPLSTPQAPPAQTMQQPPPTQTAPPPPMQTAQPPSQTPPTQTTPPPVQTTQQPLPPTPTPLPLSTPQTPPVQTTQQPPPQTPSTLVPLPTPIPLPTSQTSPPQTAPPAQDTQQPLPQQQAPSPPPTQTAPPVQTAPLPMQNMQQQLPTQILQQLPIQTIQQLPAQITHTILKYQPLGNFEGELFKSLPEPIKREIFKELPTGKTWQPEMLQKAVEKYDIAKAPEEFRQVLQTLKEQVQWTRIDQDTRPQNDKENIFYFMHEGELEKGRIKIKDDRKSNSKKQQGSSISFSIETKVKNLGNVHADLTLNKNVLNIHMQDEVGTASDAVKEERETLAKELADIGISLGELLYGKTPKIQNLPITKKTEKTNNGLDVKA